MDIFYLILLLGSFAGILTNGYGYLNNNGTMAFLGALIAISVFGFYLSFKVQETTFPEEG